MRSINKVILIGNLGKDPEVRYLENGVAFATFSMATTETYVDRNTNEKKETTQWHNIVLWRGLAEIAEKYLKKGSPIYIEGKLTHRSYERDEVTRYITEVVGKEVIMLGGRSSGDSYNLPSVPQEYAENSTSSESQQSSGNTTSQQDNSSDDDLPF